jgi:hypothetical protein
MKWLDSFSLLLLCLFVLTPIASADHSDPFANGSVRVILADGLPRQVEFAARLLENGSTMGQMTFRTPSPSTKPSAGSEIAPASEPSSSAFYFKAALDCMVVRGNRAVMGGAVTESSTESYVGRRVLLVVQDGGETTTTQSNDKLTWGVYSPQVRTWAASDAEVENDMGTGATWLATDAERDDDPGLNSDQSEFKGCGSFPTSAFSLFKVKSGDGDIHVRP